MHSKRAQQNMFDSMEMDESEQINIKELYLDNYFENQGGSMTFQNMLSSEVMNNGSDYQSTKQTIIYY